MDVKFAPVIANAVNFPDAVIRATPAFGMTDIRVLSYSGNLNQCTHTRNGRAAIAIAAQSLMKKRQPNVVLLPSYHCPALVEPFLWLGYKVRFYPVKQDLTVDPAIFQKMLTSDVTHCLVVRFFGFSQNVEQLITLSHDSGKTVIEDCAHGLPYFVDSIKQPNHKVAARICSINKILPTIDGGLLYLQSKTAYQPHYCGWTEELKAIAFLLKIPQLFQRFRKSKKNLAVDSKFNDQSKATYRYFKPSDLTSASFRHTKYILKTSNFNAIKDKRRENYLYLVKGLKNASAGTCLYTDVADEVPYVLPFLLHDEKDFARLRMQKIQVLRWEEMAPSGCEVTETYRTRLVQLPCHHKLKRSELDYIIKTVLKLVEN